MSNNGKRNISKKGILVAVLSIILVTFFSWALLNGEISISLTQSEIQDKINEKFPLNIEKYSVSVLISDPNIEFLNSGRIQLYSKLKATNKLREYNGMLTINGLPDYKDGSFYLRDIEIVDLTIAKPENDEEFELLKKNASNLLGKLNSFITNNDQELMNKNKEKFKSKLSSVSGNLKSIIMEKAVDKLSNIKLYTIQVKDDMSFEMKMKIGASKLMLKKIEVINNELVITLTVMTLVIKLIVWLLIIVFSLLTAYALVIRGGALGVAAIALSNIDGF